MATRRKFLATAGIFTAGLVAGQLRASAARVQNIGIQLYTVRAEMLADARGTLAQLAGLGYREI